MLVGAGLAAVAVVLTVATLASARRPGAPVPTLARYLQVWAAARGGYDPTVNRWLRGWLALTYHAARPWAARGAHPDVLTAWTVWLAAAAWGAAAAGARWPALAAALVVVSGLGDSLDGCVAVLTGRATRWGYVLDSLADRASDVLYLLALVAVGGAPAPALLAGLAFGMLEYLRARAGNAGAGPVGAVTIAERPTRVIVCAAALGLAAAVPAAAAASAGLWLLAGLSTVGLAQLLLAVRRTLAVPPPA